METTLLFAPLVGSLLCGFGWKFIGEKAAMWTATGLLFLSALLSWIVFLTFDGHTQTIEILRWIESGSLSTAWQFRLDRLTAIMLIVITTVSSLVHLYSFGYMDHDPQWRPGESYKPRFFAYLSFFTFAMLMLVTSDNLVQMFFGWEGVGRCLLPADRLLLPQTHRQRGGDESLHRQPCGGLRFRAGDLCPVPADRQHQLLGHLCCDPAAG